MGLSQLQKLGSASPARVKELEVRVCRSKTEAGRTREGKGGEGKRKGEGKVPRGSWRSTCLQGARSPSDAYRLTPTHASPPPCPPPPALLALLPCEPQPGLGVWGKGKPTWQMVPGAHVSVGARVSVHLVEGTQTQTPGTGWPPTTLERQALHTGLGRWGWSP